MERPDYVTDEHLCFLDNLRMSGVTNMFGAAPYVIIEFGCNNNEARAIVAYWMKTFGQENR